MFFRFILINIFIFSYLIGNDLANSNKKDIKNYLCDDCDKKGLKSKAEQKALDQNEIIDYIKLRENINTLEPTNLDEKDFVTGLNKKPQKDLISILNKSIDKSQVFISPSIGATYIKSYRPYILPTLNVKIGYQDFIGAYNNDFGLRIYSDILIASNILESIQRNPLDEEFIESSLSIFSINIDSSYELNLSNSVRFGAGFGFGFGFMSYSDEYWDTLRGFSANALLNSYLLFNQSHKIDLGLRVFFYGLGKYITRHVDPLASHNNFINPINIMVGYSYVF